VTGREGGEEGGEVTGQIVWDLVAYWEDLGYYSEESGSHREL
jgi:hypothetical protein